MDKTLSILIPSRNEMFLARTVQDLLEHIEGNTDILVGLDGRWAEPPLEDNPKVTILYYPESIGQRAMTNQLAKLSKAKYVMKVDAHCSFDQGFDKKLMEDMQDDWTVAPTMRNLHAFDWVCPNGHHRYQGPSGPCQQCGLPTERDVVWIAKESPQSTAYCFDSEPHFQYHGEWKRKQRGKLVESMSLQGSAFMMTREKYWSLGICDENFGSWGSQGIEVACKTWLSGGKVMINKNTWYAHMFRTQGGDFSFPYEQRQSKVVEAKKKARELFFSNAWDKQIRPLSWMVDKFEPPGWNKDDLTKVREEGKKFYMERGLRKSILYYTDNQLNLKIAHAVQKQLNSIGLPIVSVSLKPMDFGKNIVLPGKRGYLQMYKQIIAGLEASDADIIFMGEHDVIYHPSHFDFVPPRKDMFYYNQNFWKVWPDGFAAHWDANQVSGLCAYREHLLSFYRERIKELEKGNDRSYEPGGRDKSKYEVWNSPEPNVDVRHGANLTTSHRSPESFRDKSTCVNWKEGRAEDLWTNGII